jgi:hypothetical protein
MTEPTFLSDEAFTTLRAMRLLRKLLMRHKEMHLSELYYRCGRGLTAPQFDGIVQVLVGQQWCSLKEGDKGAIRVVIADVCEPVTQ